jgi:hypothetical protein
MTEEYKVLLEKHLKEKYGDISSNGPYLINLGEIDFLIPPLLGSDVKSFKSLKKENAKKGIF